MLKTYFIFVNCLINLHFILQKKKTVFWIPPNTIVNTAQQIKPWTHTHTQFAFSFTQNLRMILLKLKPKFSSEIQFWLSCHAWNWQKNSTPYKNKSTNTHTYTSSVSITFHAYYDTHLVHDMYKNLKKPDEKTKQNETISC